MFSRKRKKYIREKFVNCIKDKPVLAENMVDLSVMPWRDSNELPYLYQKVTFNGVYLKLPFDTPEPANHHLLYMFYIQLVKNYMLIKSYSITSWGDVNFFIEKYLNGYIAYSSIHFLYFRDVWVRPGCIIRVWTNEEDTIYRHISLFELFVYKWSHPKLFFSFMVPFNSEFNFFFDFLEEKGFLFLGYEDENINLVKFDRWHWHGTKLFKYLYVPEISMEFLTLNNVLPGSFQEDNRKGNWYNLYLSSLNQRDNNLFNLADVYYLTSYLLQRSFFLQSLFLDSTMRYLYQYGYLALVLFYHTSQHQFQELFEKKQTLWQNDMQDVMSIQEDFEVDEDDISYDAVSEDQVLDVDEDLEEDDDDEDEYLEEMEDLEPLKDKVSSDFEFIEDIDDDMEFNDDRMGI